jgi:hypothetical protein
MVLKLSQKLHFEARLRTRLVDEVQYSTTASFSTFLFDFDDIRYV